MDRMRTFLERYVVRPPRLEVEVDGKRVRGVSAFVQNGDLYTYFQQKPIHIAGVPMVEISIRHGA